MQILVYFLQHFIKPMIGENVFIKLFSGDLEFFSQHYALSHNNEGYLDLEQEGIFERPKFQLT